jgi:hypothetical protein
MPEVLVQFGVTQDQFEAMVDTIDREGYFDVGPEEGEGVLSIDGDYSLHELGLDGLDHEQSG